MGSWLPGVVVALVVGLPATLAAVLTWQSSTKARKDAVEARKDAVEARKDAAAKATKDEVRVAFESAKQLYEGGIAEAERRIENCNKRVAGLEADVEAARIRERGLRRWIGQLEDALRAAGVPVPNGEPL
jgi:hypothetical protein